MTVEVQVSLKGRLTKDISTSTSYFLVRVIALYNVILTKITKKYSSFL